jgi:hypothetical protein
MTFTLDDFKRVAWTFVQAVLGVALAASLDWIKGAEFAPRTWIIAAVAAGISAVKNLLTQPGDTLK